MAPANQLQLPETATVVLVSGLYTPALAMCYLARRLHQHGFQTSVRGCWHTARTPQQNAAVLLRGLLRARHRAVHLVGHSLGGLVVMHLLKLNHELPTQQQIRIERVVLLATPARGSALAERVYAKRWLRFLLGKSVKSGVLGGAPGNAYGSDIGVMGGNKSFGLAALLLRPAEADDGVVSLNETALPQAVDSVCIPQSHALMLFSNLCADKVATFLAVGRFSADL